MRPFKFFDDNEEDDYEPLADSVPSWMWDIEFHLGPVLNHEWVLRTAVCNGIVEFLSRFPDYTIIPIHSITGSGIRHSFGNRNDGNGWGFDIRSERLMIEYYELVLTSNRI